MSIFLSTRNGSKSRIVTQRSEKVKGLDNNATLYAFVELRCKVTDDSHLFQLEPITLIYYVSQRTLKITFLLAKLTCLEEKFGSTSKPTKDWASESKTSCTLDLMHFKRQNMAKLFDCKLVDPRIVILRRVNSFCLPCECESYCVSIVTGNHNANFLGHILCFQFVHTPHAFSQASMVWCGGGLEIGVNRILITQLLSASPFLFHIGSSDQFSSKEEILPCSLLHVLKREFCQIFFHEIKWNCENQIATKRKERRVSLYYLLHDDYHFLKDRSLICMLLS